MAGGANPPKKGKTMFNPSKYRITEQADFEVLDADGDIIFLDEEKTKPWTITIHSPGTKTALKALHEMREAMSGDLVGQMKGRKSKQDEGSHIRLRADFLMKLTIGTNASDLEYEGHTGMEALKAIYLDPFMAHVPVGLEAFHGDKGNFKQ